MKYHGFVPGKVQEKSLPSGVQEGINLDIDNCTVTLVLYDKATDGSHKDYAYVVGDLMSGHWLMMKHPRCIVMKQQDAGGLQFLI